MKPNLLFTALLIFFGSALSAQHFTLRAAGGYAFPGFIKNEPIIGPKIDPFAPEKDALSAMMNIDTLPTNDPVRGSYGQGGNFTFAFGYMINPYIGIEMGLSYHKSATFVCHQTHELTLQLAPGPPPQYGRLDRYLQARIETNAFALSLLPAIVIQGAKPGWKVYPYGRLGITLPVYGGLTHRISMDVDSAYLSSISGDPYYLGKKVDVTLKTEGAFSIGLNGALGVAYRPLPYLAITAEVSGQYLVVRAKKAEITRWDTDGTSRIEERGTYRTEFSFVDKLDNSSNNADFNPNYDSNKPKEDLRPTGPFNNLGFQIGVMFLLSKETVARKKKPQPSAQ